MNFERRRHFTEEDIGELRLNFCNHYSLSNHCPDWMGLLTDISSDDHGVLALVGPVGVNISDSDNFRSKVIPDSPSIILAALSEIIRDRKCNFSIGLPPVARDVSLFLACIEVLRKILETDMKPNSPFLKKSVLVISPDIRIRSCYCDLFVKDQPIDIAFPGSRMLTNGKIKPLDNLKQHNLYSGVCFFLPHRITFPDTISIQPSFTIIDLRFSRLNSKLNEMLSWASRLNSGIIALYSCGDKECRYLLDKYDYKDFPFDHIAIRSCLDNLKNKSQLDSSSTLNIDFQNSSLALNRIHEIININLNNDLRKIYENINKLFLDNDQQYIDFERLKWLFSIFNKMPVPLEWYENTALERGRWTLKNIISKIGVFSHNQKIGPILQSFKIYFNELYSEYINSNPKASRLIRLIHKLSNLLNQNERILTVVRDDIFANALLSWLEISHNNLFGSLDFIDICSCKQFYKYINNTYEHAIFIGPIPYRYAWILGGCIGSHLYFITYPHEIKYIEKQLSHFYDRQKISQRHKRRIESLISLGLSPEKNVLDNSLYPTLNLQIPENIKSYNVETKKSFKHTMYSFEALVTLTNEKEEKKQKEMNDVETELESYKDKAEENFYEENPISSEECLETPDGYECFEISVESNKHGKGKLWLYGDKCVEYVRPSNPNHIERTYPNALAGGDLLLLIDEAQHSDIFDKIVEISENNPRLNYISIFRNLWRRAIKKISYKYSDKLGRTDFEKLLSNLQANGADIICELTIRNWVNDIVIGPESENSIIAVGKLAETPALFNQSKKFDSAFSKIRNIHRQIGKHIAKIIRSSFLTQLYDDVNEVDAIEDHIGIPLREIIDTIDILKIRTITDVAKHINPDMIGRFMKVR